MINFLSRNFCKRAPGISSSTAVPHHSGTFFTCIFSLARRGELVKLENFTPEKKVGRRRAFISHKEKMPRPAFALSFLFLP